MKTPSLSSQMTPPAGFVLDPRSLSALKNRAQTQDPASSMKEMAKEFEAVFVQMMFKSMRAATAQDGLFDNDQTRFFTSILDQQMGYEMGKKGSLGFAKAMEAQMLRTLPGMQKKGASLEGGDALALVPSEPSSEEPLIMQHALEKLSQARLEAQAASFASLPAPALKQHHAFGERLDLPEFAPKTGLKAQASVPSLQAPQANHDFVNRVWPHATQAARALGVPAHFLVGHSALESGWGKSEIRHPDGRPTYNLFGIKADKNWKGASVTVPTTEYVGGVAGTSNERFRAYGSYSEAFADYAKFLTDNGRYQEVIGQKEPAAFARALQKSGYATDPAYAQKLTQVIEGNTLRTALAG